LYYIVVAVLKHSVGSTEYKIVYSSASIDTIHSKGIVGYIGLRKGRPGFESRQGISFLSNAVVFNGLNMHCLCVLQREIKALA
jgi:hypothetical protein